MSKSRDELLNHVLERITKIAKKMLGQEHNIKTYLSESPVTEERIELILSHIKSLKMSVEILLDEIDELHQIMITQKK